MPFLAHGALLARDASAWIDAARSPTSLSIGAPNVGVAARNARLLVVAREAWGASEEGAVLRNAETRRAVGRRAEARARRAAEVVERDALRNANVPEAPFARRAWLVDDAVAVLVGECPAGLGRTREHGRVAVVAVTRKAGRGALAPDESVAVPVGTEAGVAPGTGRRESRAVRDQDPCRHDEPGDGTTKVEPPRTEHFGLGVLKGSVHLASGGGSAMMPRREKLCRTSRGGSCKSRIDVRRVRRFGSRVRRASELVHDLGFRRRSERGRHASSTTRCLGWIRPPVGRRARGTNDRPRRPRYIRSRLRARRCSGERGFARSHDRDDARCLTGVRRRSSQWARKAGERSRGRPSSC